MPWAQLWNKQFTQLVNYNTLPCCEISFLKASTEFNKLAFILLFYQKSLPSSTRWTYKCICHNRFQICFVWLNPISHIQIYYYADSIYSSAGVREDHVQYVTVGTGAVNVFMTVAAVRIFIYHINCYDTQKPDSDVYKCVSRCLLWRNRAESRCYWLVLAYAV